MACEHATCLTLPAIFSFLQVHACSDRTPPSFVPLLSLVLASLALVPFLRESSGATAAQHEDAERAHDRLNTVLLAPLVAYIVGIWFCMLPPFPFTLALLAYVLFDVCYLVRTPHSVRMPKMVLAHHSVTLAFLLVPLHHADLAMYTAISAGAEVQTLLLIIRRRLRRNVPINSPPPSLLRLVGVIHSVCFVFIRLILHPLMLVGVFTIMHLPAPEALVVRTCQTMLCVFNAALWLRELSGQKQVTRESARSSKTPK